MKHVSLLSIISLALGILGSTVPAQAATQSLTARLSGRILLQVEQRGEAWYIDPVSQQRFYLGTATDAFALLRAKGLGIRHSDIVRFTATGFPTRLSGRILLDVDDRGQAYYISPLTLRAIRLGSAQETYQVLRQNGLGIRDRDLNRINIAPQSIPQPTPSPTPTPTNPAPTQPSTPTPIPTPTTPTSIPSNSLERRAFDAINDHRRSIGIPALAWNDTVADVARTHSRNMAEQRVPFSHDGFDERFEQINASLRLSTMAENVAVNSYVDPVTTAVRDWLNSNGHRINIENPVFTETGIGIVEGIQDEYYLTQLFIKRR
ncbi:CAP domain-containing protein [Patescibacteria group bacterium]|nr:CAP domain-containing protein [Patescibacteria group bacterium]MBP9709633.1 CAP domain-containing protein [Patescibacteria group bacterium]